MTREFINPDALPNWAQAFTQVVVVAPGRTVHVAGQVAVDKDKNLVGAGDLGAQALRAFENLATALAAGGATTADVVKLNIYVKNYQPTDAEAVSAALRQFFPHERLPASTWLGVQSLAQEGFLIEVDAVAVIEQ
ncbi:MAG: RidA family protein [Pyrinomonadaceae bacterium]